MDIHAVLEAVESSEGFKALEPDHYLVHIFSMMDAHTKDECQVGYYLKKSDKITVFEYLDGKIKITAPEEAFKEKNYISPLDIGKVKVGMDEALQKADSLVKESYPSQLLSKVITLLQNLPEFGQVWNITVITHTFNVVNIKIDAGSGKVIKHGMESLMGWKKE